jgi:hypothetical protein
MDISVMHTKHSAPDVKLHTIDTTLEAGTLLVSLKQNGNISDVSTTACYGGVDVATLSRNLGIGLEMAKRTRDVTLDLPK